MGFLEDFRASVESVPAMLQRNYALMRDLDKSLLGVRQQNEQRYEALDEQKHCIRIADEKVALATQAYDMVDAHIQQLDQYLRKIEEIRRERELAAAAAAAGASNAEGNTRSGRGEGGRGGRKKSWLAAEQPAIELELPVDPNEPRYCVCHQVSYGNMVACDNPSCQIEWFHFECVGLKEHPKGKWYCPNCVGLQKRRKGK
ncbi:hypothetical protein ZIOFF_010298 [Zingiber officinale]|uniref:PHD finger protein ING n=1 Tax=Zingiber officinale TaxID=94328 RepID=A0A8J5HLY3_ZINOF|nr:hypothetical protein ZIOFF_014235 [Zingiber officinale]KAG6528149.1 hypothetical protein ZIOFF_010298 [Zingiber officinale]